MAGQKSNSEQKSKIDRTRRALPVEAEEIEIKLDTAEAASVAPPAGPPKILDEAGSQQQDLEELKGLLHQIRDELKNLQEQVQSTEKNTRRELESIRSAQLEFARLQQQSESKNAALEKSSAAVEGKAPLAVQQSVPMVAEKPPSSATATSREKSEPQKPVVTAVVPSVPFTADRQAKLKKVEAQVFTSSQGAAAGFTLQTSLRLSGADAFLLTSERAPIQVTWYAHKVAGEESMLLKTIMTNLIEKKLDYTISADIPRIAAGLYRLKTVVTFPTARHVTTYFQGPVLQAT